MLASVFMDLTNDGGSVPPMAEFGIKSATNRLSTQVPIVTDFTNGANERIWSGGRW